MTHDPDSADDADENERAEAAALAAALDGEASAQPPPDDALAAALLMRHGGDRGQLSAERAEAILRDVLREPSKQASRGAKIVRLWPIGGVVLAAAAALLLIVRSAELRQRESTARPAVATAAPHAPAGPSAGIPQASASLLAAQSAWLQQSLAAGNAQPSDDTAAQHYEHELRAYRSELFRSLAERYPRKLGALEPALQRELRARRLR
jgi:hypothetical protein